MTMTDGWILMKSARNSAVYCPPAPAPSLFYLKLVVIRYESRKHTHVFDARACVPDFAEEQIKVFCTQYDDDFGDNFEAPCPYIS